jgi:predicted RNA-binding protein YlqC (UPF0109 family)
MKDLVEFMVKSIVDAPNKVVVDSTEADGVITLTITVDQTDMGKVIGKGGKIIKSLRHLAYARAIKENKRVQIVLTQEEPV